MYRVELIVGDISIENFTTYDINLSMYQLANTATFTATDKDFNSLSVVKQQLNGLAKAFVKIDNETVLTGFIRLPHSGYEDKKPALSIKVNSVASCLAGASIKQGKNYQNMTPFGIMSDILADANIKLKNAGNVDILKSFVTNGLEHIDIVLNRLAKYANVLIYSDADGCLVCAEKNSSKNTLSSLVTGENIVDIYKNTDTQALYSNVVLYGQQSMEDDLDIDAIIHSSISGKSIGQSRTYRKSAPIISKKYLENVIAELENGATTFKVTTNAFKSTDKTLLKPNMPINIKDTKWMNIEDTYLITDVRLQKLEGSYQAVLNLEETR